MSTRTLGGPGGLETSHDNPSVDDLELETPRARLGNARRDCGWGGVASAAARPAPLRLSRDTSDGGPLGLSVPLGHRPVLGLLPVRPRSRWVCWRDLPEECSLQEPSGEPYDEHRHRVPPGLGLPAAGAPGA